MKHLRTILLVLFILALATLACSLGRQEPASQDQAPAAEATEAPAAEATEAPAAEATEAPAAEATEAPAAEATEAPAAEATEAPAESVEGDVEEAELDLQTSVSGLEDLNSYRVAFRFDWNGTKDGQPVTGFMEMSSAYVREPPAQELYFEGEGFEAGEDQGLGKIAFVQVGDTAWFYEGESDTWMQVPAGSLDFSEGLFFQPEDLLQDFDVSKGRRSLLPQEVNGVQCHKYTFNEKDFDLSDLAEGDEVDRAEGEVYVAVDGGYVVRLVVDADFRYTDPEEVFDEGNIKMTFDISDINQPITIEPPAEAEVQAGGREDIPMLPDASVEFASAEFISYRTASSVADATQFYEDEMPKNGWTAAEDNMTFDDGAFLNYNKGDETASVIIGTDEEGTNVLISITKE
jgi:hypothetical protein